MAKVNPDPNPDDVDVGAIMFSPVTGTATTGAYAPGTRTWTSAGTEPLPPIAAPRGGISYGSYSSGSLTSDDDDIDDDYDVLDQDPDQPDNEVWIPITATVDGEAVKYWVKIEVNPETLHVNVDLDSNDAFISAGTNARDAMIEDDVIQTKIRIEPADDKRRKPYVSPVRAAAEAAAAAHSDAPDEELDLIKLKWEGELIESFAEAYDVPVEMIRR